MNPEAIALRHHLNYLLDWWRHGSDMYGIDPADMTLRQFVEAMIGTLEDAQAEGCGTLLARYESMFAGSTPARGISSCQHNGEVE